ncbi:MAG: hypothetical protein ACNS63_05080 [Candidatus Nitrospinota bacterium M3_3B_026]
MRVLILSTVFLISALSAPAVLAGHDAAADGGHAAMGHDHGATPAPSPVPAVSGDGVDHENVPIGRMKVTLMPEYDSPQVLVIQEGKFADKTAFPRQVTFTLPKQITRLTDVCSLSPGGHHFCQIFEIQEDEDKKFVNVKLPYSDFFIDYQYAPFAVKEKSTREFSFKVDTPYDIKNLEVHIQEPFRSKDFKVVPATDDVYEKDGFTVYRYMIEDVGAGAEKVFRVAYYKDDARPSVDMKYSAMKTPGLFEKRTGEILLGGGLAALALVWVVRRRWAKSRGCCD